MLDKARIPVLMERKLKICSDCGKPSILWRSIPKLCKDCANKPKNKKNKIIIDVKGREGSKQHQLNVFFASQTLQMPLNCENCNEPLNAFSLWQKRCVTAHILPKSLFESVALHPQNRTFIGVNCGCHNSWDNKGSADRKAMKVYPTAIERFNAFKTLLNQSELQKAKKYLGIE